ncbi:MAG: hypothetical protein Ct9H300mP1_35090 [Planctomycetaceae bacterium]|nr:MAG: hypothetical protein Ct9H300mP1_35090 [Planctomycetaceae bacterium]
MAGGVPVFLVRRRCGTVDVVLAQSSAPPGPLLVGYALLIAAFGFVFPCPAGVVHDPVLCSRLRRAVGGASTVHAVGVDEDLPWQYPVLFAVVLAVLGMVIAYPVFRVRVLSRYYRRGG